MKIFDSKCAVALLILGCVIALGAGAQVVNSSRSGVALDGYDVVAYYVENKAVEGEADYSTEWNGAQWHFSSDENLQLFIADPESYAPEYGGYCAYAASQNGIAPIDPQAFTVVDDKLYLNYDKTIRTRWNNKQAEYIEAADTNWPELLSGLDDGE